MTFRRKSSRRRRTRKRRTFRRRGKSRLMRKLRILPFPEFKQVNQNFTVSAMTQDPNYGHTIINQITQGSGVGERIGTKATLQSIYIQGFMECTSGVQAAHGHFLIVAIPSGETLQSLLTSQLYLDTLSGLRVLNENQNLKVLAQKRVVVEPLGLMLSTKRFTLSIKRKKVMEWITGGVTVSHWAYYFVESYFSVSGTPNLRWRSRLYYTDS